MLYVQHASTKRTQRTIKHHGSSLCSSIPTVCAISTYTKNWKLFFRMAFTIVVWCYCYWYIIIIFSFSYFDFIIIIITIIIIIIIIINIAIVIVIVIVILLLLLLLFSDCNPPCTLQSVPAYFILYIPAVYMNLGHIQYFSKPGDTLLVLPGRRNATAFLAWRCLGLPCRALSGQAGRTQTHALGRQRHLAARTSTNHFLNRC